MIRHELALESKLVTSQGEHFRALEILTSSGFFEWMILVQYYHIVLSKRPWVLAAQASKIGGGWLHGGGA